MLFSIRFFCFRLIVIVLLVSVWLVSVVIWLGWFLICIVVSVWWLLCFMVKLIFGCVIVSWCIMLR